MEISTFYHIRPSKITQRSVDLSLHTISIPLEILSCPIANLKNAVSWALKHEEDAILMIGRSFNPTAFNFKHLGKTVLTLYDQKNYIIGLTSKKQNDSLISIKKNLFLTEKWNNNDSWIILRPLFDNILKIDKGVLNRFLHREATLIDVLDIFSPSKFIIHADLMVKFNEKRINVIIPFRNIKEYIEECIVSIEKQRYKNYRVFFIDDCSNDGSLNMIERKENYIIHCNSSRKYALENIITTLDNSKFKKEDIICLIDGDDLLAHPYVFNILNSIYTKERMRLTYGSFKYLNSHQIYAYNYTKNEFRNIRAAEWKASHLKSFRYELFEEMRKLDPNFFCMKNNEGEFLKLPYDMAIMFPLLEIAGYSKSRFINSILYLYRKHENNDCEQNFILQKKGEFEIRAKGNILAKFKSVQANK
ncbi:glycosyltransferase family A protein [Sphingobacterium siyangense]|jgi:hypothetical protein|uniref:glycosyltransferase family A protein n=1 Tax=Sphingobacterium siyangense TaxID=459529 RepID=UPI0028AF17C0|nr:glycosyltransferase family A protein [Sphingobacterium siyangense]